MIAELEKTMNINLGPNVKLLGEVISWTSRGKPMPVADVRAALAQAGLDESIVKDMLPRNAFSRACKELSESRIIRVKAETVDELVFQFTTEAKDAATGNFVYNLETEVTLNKHSGTVTCPEPMLEQYAQALVNDRLVHRTAGDVTKIVQKLFDDHADLFPVRDQGGVYFVPDQHSPFTAKVEEFITKLGGSLKRFPVPAGTTQGTASVQASVCDGIEALIQAQLDLIEKLDKDSRESTLERRQEEIETIKFKIEAYKAYLAERQEFFEHQAAQAEEKLKTKVQDIMREKLADEQQQAA